MPRPWPEVLDMPAGERRLTTAERHFREKLDQLDSEDYLDEVGYLTAVNELQTAYDQACRELGNPA